VPACGATTTTENTDMLAAMGTTVAVAVAFVLVAADRIPTFNVEPGCRDVAAKAAPVGSVEACMRKEQEARNQLVSEWTQFAAADQSYCVDLTTMAGEPSYVALLTCLELRRDARRLRQQENSAAARGRR
jgi:hypothetical protein